MTRFLRSRFLRLLGMDSRSRKASPSQRSASSRRRVRPDLEYLEDRITPTTFTPMTFAGDGTVHALRGAILQANNDSGTAANVVVQRHQAQVGASGGAIGGSIALSAFDQQSASPPPSPTSSGGGTTTSPTPSPTLFQALLSLFIDGASLQATNLSSSFVHGDNFNIDNFFGTPDQLAVVRANAAAAGVNWDTLMSLNTFLAQLRSPFTVRDDIAANVPFAGPFAGAAVIAGAEALNQAVQL